MPGRKGGGGGGTTTVVTTSKRTAAGGRTIVAARVWGTGLALALSNSLQTFRNRHVMPAALAGQDFRLFFGGPLAIEYDHPYPVVIKVGLETPAGTVVPVTWQGRDYTVIKPGGRLAESDVIPAELAAGDIFWTRVFASTPFGYFTTLAAAASIGDTTISVNALPGLTALDPQRGILGTVQLDQFGSVETVVVKDFSGTGPYTLTLASALTKAHSSAAPLGQVIFQNGYQYSDLGEGVTSGTTVAAGDLAWSTTAIPALSTVPTTTLAAAANIGDTMVVLSAAMYGGEQLTIDTAGNAETVTVRALTGSGTRKAYLTAPLTKAHASGVAVAGQYAVGPTIRPTIIAADRVSGTTKPVVLGVGDSKTFGQGDEFRRERSWLSRALGTSFPYYNIALSGEAGLTFQTIANRLHRSALLNLADWATYLYGHNDVYLQNRTLAQIQAIDITIWKALKQRSIKVAVGTLTPTTTTTDDWATTGNQTISNTGFDTIRKAVNAWRRDGCPVDTNGAAVAVGTAGAARAVVYSAAKTVAQAASGPAHPYVDLVWDPADALESARDSGLWKADASGPYTYDGIHESNAGYALVASAFDTNWLI